MDIKRVRRWFLFLIITSLLGIILLILSCFQFSDVADSTLRLEWKKIPSKGVVSHDTDRIFGQAEELVSKHHTSYQNLRKHRLQDGENYALDSNSFFHLTPDSFQTNLAEHSRKHTKGSGDEDELVNGEDGIVGKDDEYSVEESAASSEVFTEESWVAQSQAGETVQYHHLDNVSKMAFNKTTDNLNGKVEFDRTKLKYVRNYFLENAVGRSRKGAILKEDVIVEPMANYTNMLPVSEIAFLRLKADGVLRRNVSRTLFNMAPEPFLKTPLIFSSKTRSSCWFVNDVTISSHQRMRCLPYFYLIGMPKCGTTDLYDKITSHPSVHYILQKEPHWWTRRRFGRGLKDLNKPFSYEDYLDHFDGLVQEIYEKGMPERMVAGDGSASTMWQQSENALANNLGHPEVIRELQPEVKLIAILREPVQRVFSDYLFFSRKNVSAKTFHKLVLAEISLYTKCCRKRSPLYCAGLVQARRSRPTLGLYSIFLVDWLKVFPRDQMLILRLRDWNADCLTLLPKIYSFLELETLSDDFIRSTCTQRKRNVNSKRKFPMLNETAEILTNFYQPYNEELAALLRDDRFLWLD